MDNVSYIDNKNELAYHIGLAMPHLTVKSLN